MTWLLGVGLGMLVIGICCRIVGGCHQSVDGKHTYCFDTERDDAGRVTRIRVRCVECGKVSQGIS